MASATNTARTSVTALTVANQTSGPDTRLPQRALDRKVGEERVEFTVGPGRVQRFKPLVKLVRAEAPLSRGVPQPFGNLLPIGV